MSVRTLPREGATKIRMESVLNYSWAVATCPKTRKVRTKNLET